MSTPLCCVLLPAAGVGSRMGDQIPKQFCEVLDRPLISYTIQCFERIQMIKNIIVSVSADRMEYMNHVLNQFNHHSVSLIEGAETRHRSIYNAVKAVPYVCPDVDIVIIHDAVRPLVDEESVLAVANSAFEHGAAGVVRPLVSTVVSTDKDGFLDHSLDRSNYRASEMPQAFKYDVIKLAYEKSTDHDLDYGTECLHLAQQYGGVKVRLLQGLDNLWKITYRKDMIAFQGLLKASVTQIDVVFKSCTECKILVDGIRESLHVQAHQEVVVNSYVSDSCTAVQCQHCSASCSNTSAVVCLYDSTDKFNKHLQGFLRQTKHSYSVIIIAVIVKSTSDSFCTFMDSVKQLANVLPDDIIANGVIINEEASGTLKKASKIVASIVVGRNSAFSGQTFFCLS